MTVHSTQKESEIAITQVKEKFESLLRSRLNLIRVSAPLFVRPSTGLNDDLNGIERAVSFNIPALQDNVEIVQSLAKWKRDALSRLSLSPGEGIYTLMNAIRRDEHLSDIHSVYVDQYDWEKVIDESQRSLPSLISCVREIYHVIRDVQEYINTEYPSLYDTVLTLPSDLSVISSSELELLYPDQDPKEREDLIAKERGAVFITQIGYQHDHRSPDYDDWTLNGDLILWSKVHQRSIEISSMGVRVNAESLLKQLKHTQTERRLLMQYHQDVVNDKLPLTIGGGIGQSRLCMYLLGKRHIGEVQCSVWPQEIIDQCHRDGITLL